MNKYTVTALFKRAYDKRLGELQGTRWRARDEIRKTARVAKLEKEIAALTEQRDKLIQAYADPREKKAAREIDALKKQYRDLSAKLGFAITAEEKKKAVTDIKAFLKSLPNCEEARLLS